MPESPHRKEPAGMPPEPGAPLLHVEGLSKSFPGVKALDDVSFTVRSGQIHALMGENGAGKSTLIKVLTGVYPRDCGSIRSSGMPLEVASPREAEDAGISTVYQEVNLIPTLSVAENLALGRQPSAYGFLNWRRINEDARDALAKLDMEIDVTRDLASYSMAIQQMVAIARALAVDAKLLVLDEPTSSLDEQEVNELFTVMRSLRDSGLGIVFITHFLEQAYEIADAITVLRNGCLVGEYPTRDLPRMQLVGLMLGKDVAEIPALEAASAPAAAEERKECLLEARGLGRQGGVHPLDISIAEGEVVGLAGLLGSGRTETARLLYGADRANSGEIRFAGGPAHMRSPKDAIRRGIAACSEDRKTEGIIPHLSVRENIILAMQANKGIFRRIPKAKQTGIADHYIRALGIKTPSLETPIRNLSGGNQQKVLLARWLAIQPRLIILDEPTRGIDVGAKAEIERLIADLRDKEGMSVLFISSELEEVVRVCSRVNVFCDRRKVDEFVGADIDEHRIMHTIASAHEKHLAGEKAP